MAMEENKQIKGILKKKRQAVKAKVLGEVTYILEKRWRKENWKIRKHCSEFRFPFFGIGMKIDLFQSRGHQRMFNLPLNCTHLTC